MIRSAARVLTFSSLMTVLSLPALSQTSGELQDYFKNSIGLSQEQITDIRGGKSFAKVMKSRIPDEIFVWGAVYVKANPESYVQFASDFDRLAKLPEFLAIRKFSNPPQLADLEGFTFDADDIKALKECKPSHCDVQLPAQAMEHLQQSIDWNAPDVDRQVNQLLHQRAIERLLEYQSKGNAVLGFYHDKGNPTDVSKQFEYMLSYAQVLPKYAPDFHHYLLAYPAARPEHTEDMFYWAKVKFGLKPTLRVVQLIIMRGTPGGILGCAIAEKQLYSSHYFETALDLTFCVPNPDNSKQPGFYLVRAMGSEQVGLTGLKGSIVRKVAVGRTASSLEKSLAAIKNILEAK
jgi:hypothetical protein